MKRKEKEPEPNPHYDLMCKLHDCRNIVRDQRDILNKLDGELAECLLLARKGARQ